MMKIIGVIVFLMLAKLTSSAQSPQAPLQLQPEFREVSGVVLDSAGKPLPKATIKLISAKDSLITYSDNDGIFIFERVRNPSFMTTVSSLGYKTTVHKYLNSGQTKKIVLSPITLRDDAYDLKTVTINCAPSIVYKQDTVEFRASDYKVPPFATVDELLKKMEAMEVGNDGSLYYQGQQVSKAKLNGKVFSGGSVAQAIQNLPANIVEKIQIVDDYGDQAARTGIKDGDPKKVLNITTQADKSIGNLATITSQGGNQGRYSEQVSAQNINANRVISLIGGVSKLITGVASSTFNSSPLTFQSLALNSAASTMAGGPGPGTSQAGSPTISYTNTWNKNLSLTGSYGYNFNNTNSMTNNYGNLTSSKGINYFSNNSTTQSNNRGQAAKFELDYNIGKFDYVQINPSFSLNNANSTGNIATDNLNYYSTGFEHPVVNFVNTNPSNNQMYGLSALFVHAFRQPHRNFSVQAGVTKSTNQIDGGKTAEYEYFADSTLIHLIKDSTSHLLVFKKSKNTVYRGVVTYVQPLSRTSQIEVIAQLRNSSVENRATSDTVLASGERIGLARLANIYNFSFTEAKTSIAYSYEGKKSNLLLGLALVPTRLVGTEIDNNTNNEVSTSRSDLRIIPVLRYSYSWSVVEKFQLSYSGLNNEPDFQQLQPFTDRSDPNNIIIGNPNLRPTFTHTLAANYNKYYPNNKFNISFNINAQLYANQISSNINQVTTAISSTLNKTINEINYVNLSGDKSITGYYGISKQLNNRSYNLALNGYIAYGQANAISNNSLYHKTVWSFNERFGPRISVSDTKVMINPFIGYNVNKSSSSLLPADDNIVKTLKLAIDGQFYLPKSFQISFEGGKNYISGLTGYNKNPLVVNAGMQKRFKIQNQSLAFTFNAFDVFHQNNFIQQTVTAQSKVYTLSNTSSRYFLLGLKLNLQKWGGTPMRNGEPMKRRGDGSFIN